MGLCCSVPSPSPTTTLPKVQQTKSADFKDHLGGEMTDELQTAVQLYVEEKQMIDNFFFDSHPASNNNDEILLPRSY